MTSKAMIAVASDGETVDSQISDHAARCPYYLLFDSTGALTEALTNPCEVSAGPAGARAADLLAGKGVTALIAADFGHRMLSELDALGIEHTIREGTVKQVIADLIHQ